MPEHISNNGCLLIALVIMAAVFVLVVFVILAVKSGGYQ